MGQDKDAQFLITIETGDYQIAIVSARLTGNILTVLRRGAEDLSTSSNRNLEMATGAYILKCSMDYTRQNYTRKCFCRQILDPSVLRAIVYFHMHVRREYALLQPKLPSGNVTLSCSCITQLCCQMPKPRIMTTTSEP